MAYQFDPAVFKRRRERFLKKMEDGVALIPSAPEFIRNGDVHHEYRQQAISSTSQVLKNPGLCSRCAKETARSPLCSSSPSATSSWRSGTDGAPALRAPKRATAPTRPLLPRKSTRRSPNICAI